MNNDRSSLLRSAGGPWSLGSGGAGGGKQGGSTPSGAGGGQQAGASGSPAAGQSSQQTAQIQLTRHEKRTFTAQTVQLAGNAFVDCTFDSCTLVLTNAPFVFSGKCLVQRCNWRIEYDLLWGAPAMRAQLRQILDSMDSTAEPTPHG